MPEEKGQVEAGQRWEDRDWRESGRVIEIQDAGSSLGLGNPYVKAVVVEAPQKPWTVGRETRMRLATLTRRYRLKPAQNSVEASNA
jgi:hypothetical protein